MRTSLTESLTTAAAIAIAVSDGKLRLALPEAVWHRTIARRKLRRDALTKPALVAVAGCLASKRGDEAGIVGDVRAWVGYLAGDLEVGLDFVNQEQAGLNFGSRACRSGPRTFCFSYSRFCSRRVHGQCWKSKSRARRQAATARGIGRRHQAEHRSAFRRLGEAQGPSAASKAEECYKRVESTRLRCRHRTSGIGVRDHPRAVEVARRSYEAAAPEVGRSPKSPHKKVVGPLSKTEREDEEPDAVEDTGESGETAPVPSVEKAILELTKIAGKLTEAKEKKDSLEVLLDGGSGSRKQFRRWRESGSVEECCCFASTAESLGPEAQHCLPEHLCPTAERLPVSSCEARRAIGARSHHPRLARQPVSSPELHQPSALKLANFVGFGMP